MERTPGTQRAPDEPPAPGLPDPPTPRQDRQRTRLRSVIVRRCVGPLPPYPPHLSVKTVRSVKYRSDQGERSDTLRASDTLKCQTARDRQPVFAAQTPCLTVLTVLTLGTERDRRDPSERPQRVTDQRTDRRPHPLRTTKDGDRRPAVRHAARTGEPGDVKGHTGEARSGRLRGSQGPKPTRREE